LPEKQLRNVILALHLNGAVQSLIEVWLAALGNVTFIPVRSATSSPKKIMNCLRKANLDWRLEGPGSVQYLQN
jgi:hypothetical protein